MASRTHNIPNKREQGAGKAFPLGGRRHGRAVTDEGCTMRQQATGNRERGNGDAAAHIRCAPRGNSGQGAKRRLFCTVYSIIFSRNSQGKRRKQQKFKSSFSISISSRSDAVFPPLCALCRPTSPCFFVHFSQKAAPGPRRGGPGEGAFRGFVYTVYSPKTAAATASCVRPKTILYI